MAVNNTSTPNLNPALNKTDSDALKNAIASSETMRTLADLFRTAVKEGLKDAQNDEEYQTNQFDVMASAGRQWYLDAREEERLMASSQEDVERSKQMVESLANVEEDSKEARIARLLHIDQKSDMEKFQDNFNDRFDRLLSDDDAGGLRKLAGNLKSSVEDAFKAVAPAVGRRGGHALQDAGEFIGSHSDDGGHLAGVATKKLGQVLQSVSKIG